MLLSTVLMSGVFAQDDSSGGSIISLLFIPLIIVAGYFFMIRPMRRRQRDQVAVQRELAVGDEVMTTAGIYGFITGIEGDVVWLEIDDDVQIRIARAGIQRRVTPTEVPEVERESTDLGSTDGE